MVSLSDARAQVSIPTAKPLTPPAGPPQLGKPAGNLVQGGGGENLVPLFVPIGTTGEKMADGKPLRAADVLTRKEYLTNYFVAPGLKNGNFASVYTAYFYAIVCLVLMLVTYGISVYLSAVFAFLTGYLWSDRIVNQAWAATWLKGRAIIETM